MPRINTGRFTCPGRLSETNGDAVLVLSRPPKGGDKGATLAAVMDGLGGDAVSEMACSTLSGLLTDFFRTRDLAEPGSILSEAVKAANHRIFSERNSQRSLRGMGASMAAVIIVENDLHIAHVGDCRLYLQRGSSLYRLTRDHSWREDGESRGTKEVADHQMDKAVTRSIGYRKEIEIDLAMHRIRKGDQILLCTDGVSDTLTEREIMDCLGEAKAAKASRTIAEVAVSRGDDDASSVVLHFGMPDWRMKRLTIAGLLFILSFSLISLAAKKIIAKKSREARTVTVSAATGNAGRIAGTFENLSSSASSDGASSDDASGPGAGQGRTATEPGRTVKKFELPDFLEMIAEKTTPGVGVLEKNRKKLISSAIESLIVSPGNDLMDACAALRFIKDPDTADLAFVILSRIVDNMLSKSIDSASLGTTDGELIRNWQTDIDNPSRFVTMCASRQASHCLEIRSDSGSGITVEAEALPARTRTPFLGLRPLKISPVKSEPGNSMFKFEACPGDRLLFKISSAGADPKSGFRMIVTAGQSSTR